MELWTKLYFLLDLQWKQAAALFEILKIAFDRTRESKVKISSVYRIFLIFSVGFHWDYSYTTLDGRSTHKTNKTTNKRDRKKEEQQATYGK